MEPEWGTFRGERIHLLDAPMMLTRAELDEVEVTLEDGSVTRWFRECNPEFHRDGDGILSF